MFASRYMKRAYRHLFFDLDRTLWDFDRNSAATLSELFEVHELGAAGIESAMVFSETYRRINHEMWDDYRKGAIDQGTLRTERFTRALKALGLDDEALGLRLGVHYLSESPKMPHLFPGALETLAVLREQFELHIITNGFEDVQHVKLEHSRLRAYFGEVITSEAVGVKKPDAGIFRHALSAAGADPETSLMVGDDIEVDLLGAKRAGMDQVFFNPDRLEHNHDLTFEVSELPQLVALLV